MNDTVRKTLPLDKSSASSNLGRLRPIEELFLYILDVVEYDADKWG